MSLLRLLTAGRSLVGLKDSASRYHESKYRLLPKFGSGKNPFQGKSTSTTAEALTATNIAADAKEKPTPASPTPALPAPAQTISTVSTNLPNHDRRGVGKERKIASWISKLRAKGFGRKQARTTRAIPQVGKSPVQGELSLDQVRVVRNDLSDADLEVVTAGTATDSQRARVKVEPSANLASVAAPSRKQQEQLSMAGKP